MGHPGHAKATTFLQKLNNGCHEQELDYGRMDERDLKQLSEEVYVPGNPAKLELRTC